MLATNDARHGIGGNLPPTDMELLAERLTNTSADIVERAAELRGGADRIPDIADEATAGKVAAFMAQCTAAEKTVETRRKAEKDVFNALGNAVQAFFKPLDEKLKEAKSLAAGKLLAYQREQDRKAAEARRIAAEAAETARKEAERLAAEAQTDADLDKAIEHEEAAQVAEIQAATVAAPAPIRSGFGVSASIRRNVVFTVKDIGAMPRHLLMPNDAAIKAHIATRQKDQLPTPIAGVEFSWEEKMVAR